MPNHIQLASTREPPEEILAALRVLDQRYDLHYLGDGRWAVGRVVPNRIRRTIGAKMKANIGRNPNMARQKMRYRLAELAMEGFGVVGLYRFRGEPTSELIADVARREYAFQHEAEREFARRLEASEIHSHLDEATLEDIEYREKHVAPQLFRNAHSVDMGRSVP